MRTPKSIKLLALLASLAVLAFLGFRLFSNPGSSGLSLFRHLNEAQITDVRLTTDMESIMAKDSSWFPAELSWEEKEGTLMTVSVELEARGKNRREVCEFPPLKMRVVPGDKHPFGKGGYKIVTHCLQGKGESLLLREYLVYQLYGALTENNFQARLLRITYADEAGETAPAETWAILLESKKEMLKRLDAEDVKSDEPLKAISASDYHLFAVFQFMIGNTDWNMDLEHNVRLISRGKGGLPVPVPYDFDRSGLVNAPYAEPHPMLPITDVRERLFQWRGKDRRQLEPVLGLFRERHDQLIGLVWEQEALSLSERQDIVRYLEEFFANMDDLLSQVPSTADGHALLKHEAAG